MLKLTVFQEAKVKPDKLSILQYLQACFIQPLTRTNYLHLIDDVIWLSDMVWTVGTFAATGLYHKKRPVMGKLKMVNLRKDGYIEFEDFLESRKVVLKQGYWVKDSLGDADFWGKL